MNELNKIASAVFLLKSSSLDILYVDSHSNTVRLGSGIRDLAEKNSLQAVLKDRSTEYAPEFEASFAYDGITYLQNGSTREEAME